MSERILVLDIAGMDTALASSSRAVPQWASNVSSVLLAGQIPSGITLSTDPATGQSDAGGTSVRTRDISALLKDVTVTAATALDGPLSATATSVDVLDASLLPSSGKIWVGQECISYLTIVGNTLTTCTRAQLGTYAAKHNDGALVYAQNPATLGRRVVLSWQDARAPSTSSAWTRLVGFLDAISWDDGAYTLQIISAAKLATDEKVLASTWIKGSLSADFPGTLNDLYLDHEGDAPWSVYSSTRGYAHVRIDDEIIKIEQAIRPANAETINSHTAPNRLFVSFPTKFRAGQKLDITDSGGTVKIAGVTVIAIHDASSASSYVDVAGITGYTFAAGDKLAANYTTVVPKGRLTRGEFGTQAADHEAGTEATEVRALEGEFIEQILLPLLCSVDGSGSHGVASGAYDILPSGWGAGLDRSFIDLAGLQQLSRSGRSGHRRYLWTEAVQLQQLLAWASLTCNATIFWTELGKLAATLREDLYPGSETNFVGTSWHREGTIPSAEVRTDRLYNAAEVLSDFDPITKEPTHTLFVEIEESKERYGRRHLEISDPGIIRATSETALTIALTGWLRWRSLPYPEVTLQVRLAESQTWRPGDLVDLSVQHLPNMLGSQGLAGTWEIIEVQPSDAQGQVGLRIIYRGTPPNVAHVAPAGIVSSANAITGEVVLQATSATNLAPASNYSAALPFHNDNGTEDSDWFIEGDLVTLWDVSTLGSATTHNATITSIDYGSRTLTLDSVPMWVGAGDLVRLREYAGFASAASVFERQGVLVALADSTSSPPDLGAGNPAVEWGM